MALPTVPKTFTFDQWRQAYNALIVDHNDLLVVVDDVTGGSGGTYNPNIWRTVTSTAVNKTLGFNEYCYVTASGTTITLPLNPTAGTTVGIAVGNFTNTVIGRNSETIMGGNNMTIDIANTAIILIYVNNDWRLV